MTALYIAILTDGKEVKFVRSTNPKRKGPLLTKDFAKAKRFTKLGVHFLEMQVGSRIAIGGALLEFHKVEK